MPIRVGQLTRDEVRARDQFFEPIFRAVHRSWDELAQGDADARAYRSRQMEYAYSEPAKLYSCLRTIPNAPLQEVRELAALVNPGARNCELVPWSWHRKPNGGGRRPVCDLPPALKAKHYIIKDLLFASGRAPAHLYDIRGKGTQAAASRVIQALEEGYNWCWTGDIRDCFQRVSPSALRTLLPLPSSLVRNCLDHRELNISREPMAPKRPARVSYVVDGARRHGPRGLLQGSPASNAVLSALLADMADAVNPLDCVICVFADNIFLAAQSEQRVLQAVSLVRGYLSAHLGGSFRLHKENLAAPGQEFEYVGYKFSRADMEVTLEPTHAGYERMYGAFADAEDKDIKRADGQINEVEAKLRCHLSAYPLWASSHEVREIVRYQSTNFAKRAAIIAANLSKIGGSEHSIDRADLCDLPFSVPSARLVG